MREKFNGNFFQSQNSSKFYISSRYKISIYPTRSIVEIRNQNYEIHALLPLQLDHRMSKRNTFPTVYEIGQPWPLVITSHHSGNDIFERAFRNLLQLISRISPLISRPFEVSDPLPCIDITTRIVLLSVPSLPPLLCTVGAKFGEQTRGFETWLGETIIDTFECNSSRLEFARLEFGIPPFPVVTRFSL